MHIKKGKIKMKERQFTEDICKVLVHEEPEVMFALLKAANIEADAEKDNVYDVIYRIRGLRA